MREPLSGRQREIYEFIRRRIRERGYPPSVREIGEAVGLSSSSTVHGHLARLEEKGYIRRDPTKPRAIEVFDLDRSTPAQSLPGVRFVPALGRVTAGAPILALEEVEDTLPVPAQWTSNAEVFALTVRGDSMIDAGIMDGDQLVVRKQSTARDGEIVVALLGEEATVKRFFREADRVRLQPENARYEPIFAHDVVILGKVIGLLRKF